MRSPESSEKCTCEKNPLGKWSVDGWSMSHLIQLITSKICFARNTSHQCKKYKFALNRELIRPNVFPKTYSSYYST
jgi:hypothetical protein